MDRSVIGCRLLHQPAADRLNSMAANGLECTWHLHFNG
jgi:hypothetical protein